MSSHARLGPSNHRWPNCPGSVREEAPYPDIAGEAAIDGTGSHTLLEQCMKHGARKANVFEGQIVGANHSDKPNGWLVDSARCERVQMCLDYISRRRRELLEEHPKAVIEVECESKADPGGMFGRDDWWGTVDITILVHHAITGKVIFIEVIDYKDGRGWVNAKDNTQLVSYAGGKLRPHITNGPEFRLPVILDLVDTVRMTIVQPKTHPVVRYEDVSVPVIMARLNEMAAAAFETDKPDAPLIPDNKGGKGYCQWCKHKPNCTAQAEKSAETTMDLIATDSQDIFELVSKSVDKVLDLTNEELTQLSDARAGIISVFDKVEEEIERRIDTGIHVSGFAMQAGNSSNSWNEDEEAMVKVFRARKLKQDDFYPKKLISPAQFLKLSNLTAAQKEKVKKEYITNKAGALKLTRVAYADKPSVEDMFAGIDKEVAQSPTTVSQSLFETEPSFL